MRAWLPSRRSTEHQIGGFVITAEGHRRSGRSTGLNGGYFVVASLLCMPMARIPFSRRRARLAPAAQISVSAGKAEAGRMAAGLACEGKRVRARSSPQAANKSQERARGASSEQPLREEGARIGYGRKRNRHDSASSLRLRSAIGRAARLPAPIEGTGQ